jgi:hypothetical protein
VWFTFALRPDNEAELSVCCAAMGFFMTGTRRAAHARTRPRGSGCAIAPAGVLPVGLDLAVECVFPINESVSSTLLMVRRCRARRARSLG